MINAITLTSSMRSNLASLKTIATQMSKTQQTLSTGKKVNSAIDNASSYYQARSLTNRANDLNSLLDSMGQGIQTIQAATQGLDNAISFIEQATAVANQAYEVAEIPEKEWFIDKVGENGAVVSTAQELKDAITSGKETICVYGKIDYFDGEEINLKDGQKLVGTEYFTGFSGVEERFSQLNMSNEIDLGAGRTAEISDLDIKFEGYVLRVVYAVESNLTIRNANIKLLSARKDQNTAVYSLEAKVILEGKNEFTSTTKDNIQGRYGNIALYNYGGVLEVKEGSELNLRTYSDIVPSVRGSIFVNYGTTYIEKNSVINFSTGNNSMSAINSGATYVEQQQVMYVESGVKINIDGCENLFRGMNNNSGDPAILDLAKGVEISIKNDSGTNSWITKEDYVFEFNALRDFRESDLDSIATFQKRDKEFSFDRLYKIATKSDVLDKQADQYSMIMGEMDKLMIDSSYQGINLLTGGELKVTFNEGRDHKLTVKGKDMRSENIGVKTKKWETKEDVKNAIDELTQARNNIRNFQAELGNNYSIIQTRQNFTEALSDVLETGADNLVLADMNETSAEYLMLQTRQQLAVNSLSLASQSASSILSLF